MMPSPRQRLTAPAVFLPASVKTAIFLAVYLVFAGSPTAASAQASRSQESAPAGPTLTITSEAVAADAYLDGERVGLTPARVYGVTPGEHTVRVVSGGLEGTRRFTMGERNRVLSVPFEGLSRPFSVGIEGSLAFRGDASMLLGGLSSTYHLSHHEFGVTVDYFTLRGTPTLRMDGVVGRFEYAVVPWWNRGGEDIAIRPLKLRVRLNVAQSLGFEQVIDGAEQDLDDVAALGAGLAVGSEIQWRWLGIEPSIYYDGFFVRSVEFGERDIRPNLNNAGVNLRLKYYFP